MDIVTAVRSQVPAQESGTQSAPERTASVAAASTQRPVTATIRSDAVRHTSALSAQVVVGLADRNGDQHPARAARAAAEAARAAYIKASIAAGVNPLPLPGR